MDEPPVPHESAPTATAAGNAVSKLPYEERLRLHELYLDYSRELGAARVDSFNRLSDAVVKISSGALGLSLVFLSDIVPLSTATDVPLVVGSWGAFAVSICSTVVSYVTSQKAHDHQDELARRGYLEGEEGALAEVPKWSHLTTVLNWTAVIGFLAGLVLTIWFVAQNLL